PRRNKTVGPARGATIPRLILARADALPFANGSVGVAIVERTPLTAAGLREIARIIAPGGTIILRHVPLAHSDRHALAKRLLPGHVRSRIRSLYGQSILETTIVPVGE